MPPSRRRKRKNEKKMNAIEKIIERAAALDKTVVLPEGMDERVITAACACVYRKIAKPVVLGTPEEIAERPDKCFSAKYLRLPAFLMPTAGVSREEGSDEKRLPGMAEIYRLIVRDPAECRQKILAAIMEHDYASGAVLWHCSEGKDRTGIVAALVLMALILGAGGNTLKS